MVQLPCIGLSCPLTKPPFWSCAIYFHYGVVETVLTQFKNCMQSLICQQNQSKGWMNVRTSWFHTIHGMIVYSPTWMVDSYGKCNKIYQSYGWYGCSQVILRSFIWHLQWLNFLNFCGPSTKPWEIWEPKTPTTVPRRIAIEMEGKNSTTLMYGV